MNRAYDNQDDYGLNDDLRAYQDEGESNLGDRAVVDEEYFDEPLPDETVQKTQSERKRETFISKYWIHILAISSGIAVFVYAASLALNIMAPRPPSVNREVLNISADKPVQEQRAMDPVRLEETVEQDEQQIASQQAPVAEREQPIMPPAVTQRTEAEQDDAFYDNLVQAAGNRTAVVKNETDAKLVALSDTVANSALEMKSVMGAIQTLSEDVKKLQAQVQASSDRTVSLEGKLSKVSSSLDDLSKKTDEKIKDVSKAAVAAAVAAIGNSKAQKAEGSGKLVLVGGPMKSDYPQQTKQNKPPVITKREINQVKPQQIPAIASTMKPTPAPQNKGNQGAQCRANTVSQNWKVKGITSSGAYVRRTDGRAAMLRIDDDVAGFGRVVSFDPVSRTVCTTSGLIAR